MSRLQRQGLLTEASHPGSAGNPEATLSRCRELWSHDCLHPSAPETRRRCPVEACRLGKPRSTSGIGIACFRPRARRDHRSSDRRGRSQSSAGLAETRNRATTPGRTISEEGDHEGPRCARRSASQARCPGCSTGFDEAHGLETAASSDQRLGAAPAGRTPISIRSWAMSRNRRLRCWEERQTTSNAGPAAIR